ncbi:hypothetical protein [Paenibacillus barengoltzii]|nr:hypothetical protein [Paenibacillus barengoltzii]
MLLDTRYRQQSSQQNCYLQTGYQLKDSQSKDSQQKEGLSRGMGLY